MGGLFRIMSFTAPVILAVLVLTFFQQQKHSAEMDRESASFDRQWNESMQSFARSPAERTRYEQRAFTAQQRYSSAQAELAERKKKVNRVEGDLDKTLNDIDKREGVKH